MSWDAIIVRCGDVKTIDDLPPDFAPPPIASSTELQMTLRDLFPDGNHYHDGSHLEGDDFWLELNHGCHTNQFGNVSAIGVRCNAAVGAIKQLQKLCDVLKTQLFDVQTGDFADFSTETENSIVAFTAWRDRVLSQHQEK
jgi:hypothetical protein